MKLEIILSVSESAKKWASNFNCNQNIDIDETEQTILHILIVMITQL